MRKKVKNEVTTVWLKEKGENRGTIFFPLKFKIPSFDLQFVLLYLLLQTIPFLLSITSHPLCEVQIHDLPHKRQGIYHYTTQTCLTTLFFGGTLVFDKQTNIK